MLNVCTFVAREREGKGGKGVSACEVEVGVFRLFFWGGGHRGREGTHLDVRLDCISARDGADVGHGLELGEELLEVQHHLRPPFV